MTATSEDSQDAVLQFLAVLAYPRVSEKEKRNALAEAIHAALYKSPIWEDRNNKHDSAAFRARVPGEYRRIKNRKIEGLIRRGVARLSHRIIAGNLALRFTQAGYYTQTLDTAVSSPHESTSRSIRLPAMIVESRSTQPPGSPRRLQLVAPRTFRDACLDVVKLKMSKEGVFLSEDDAVENFKKQVWVPSLPVLHLACALYVETCRFPVIPANAIGGALEPAGERRRREQSQEGAQFIGELTSDPSWICRALVLAEGYRNLLRDCIPEGNFDPATALRFLSL